MGVQHPCCQPHGVAASVQGDDDRRIHRLHRLTHQHPLRAADLARHPRARFSEALIALHRPQ